MHNGSKISVFNILQLILLVVTFATTKAYASKNGTNYIVNKFKDKVFKVTTSISEDSDKASYGTGFPISNNGLIVTNYHVVSDSLDPEENYKVIVHVGDKKFEAAIIDFSSTHDLALLKIDHQFDSFVPLSETPPEHGDIVYPMGYPQDLDLTIVNGPFNGEISNGGYRQYHVTAPINSGMSGGPALNDAGEVIGVNVSVLIFAQEVSFLVPVRFVKQLNFESEINYLKNKELVAKKNGVDLVRTQDNLTNEILTQATRQYLGDFSFIKSPEGAKCWERDNSDKEKRRYSNLMQSCAVRPATYISRSVQTGGYSIKNSSLNNSFLLGMLFYDLLNSHHQRISFTSRNHNIHTPQSCNTTKVTNTSGIPLKVDFCIQRYKDLEGAHDMRMRVTSLLKERSAFSISVNLLGFSLGNIKKITDKIVNGVRFNDSDS